MPTKPMDEKKGKKRCHCRIRGVVRLVKIKSGINYAVDPYDYGKWLRRFRFCPLCGKKL